MLRRQESSFTQQNLEKPPQNFKQLIQLLVCTGFSGKNQWDILKLIYSCDMIAHVCIKAIMLLARIIISHLKE